ncbi:MAG: class I SAM-dependent methyltransferase [Candidatus Micrarchaeia archaeon]
MSDLTTSKVKKFYEEHPYPNQIVLSKESLFEKKHTSVMKHILSCANLCPNDLKGLSVLDAGCGTGEKSAYMALMGAEVDAFDISKTSIEIANKNAKLLKINVNYFQSDFAKFNSDKKYDLIIAIGTLHHTYAPKENFYRIASHLKENGKIVVGLYNVYGRLACRVHRKLLQFGAKNPSQIIRTLKLADEKNKVRFAAVADRFASPHESYHCIQEVLNWFEKAGVHAIASYPKTDLQNRLSIHTSQFGWLFSQTGFFFMGGEKQSFTAKNRKKGM